MQAKSDCPSQVFYDPHDLMASLVDANNISYRMPDAMANELPWVLTQTAISDLHLTWCNAPSLNDKLQPCLLV